MNDNLLDLAKTAYETYQETVHEKPMAEIRFFDAKPWISLGTWERKPWVNIAKAVSTKIKSHDNS